MEYQQALTAESERLEGKNNSMEKTIIESILEVVNEGNTIPSINAGERPSLDVDTTLLYLGD